MIDNKKSKFFSHEVQKNSSVGDFRINVPRDRNGEFDPIIVEKGNNDI